MRFEIRYFFLEIGLSPSGFTQSQEKSILFQTSLYTFAFHGLACATIQCVHNYIVRVQLYSACATIQCGRNYTVRLLREMYMVRLLREMYMVILFRGPPFILFLTSPPALSVRPGLNPISRKRFLILILIIYFHFPRACVRNYTVRAKLYSACVTIQCIF